jgi:hypothetical protein
MQHIEKRRNICALLAKSVTPWPDAAPESQAGK